MLDDRTIRAARNNAQWCDAVCRAHRIPGEFHEGIWLNRHPVPRFYPNAETLAEPTTRQLDLIDELIAIVGYEHDGELRNAHALGFESLGPLRVWTFTKAST